MGIDYHSSLIQFIAFDKLPLWVVPIQAGRHPERIFHNHEYSEIVVVTNGNALHLVDSDTARIKTGDVMVIHPGHVHAYDNTGDMELINIIYDRNKLPLPLLDSYSLPLFQLFFPHEINSEPQATAHPVVSLKPEDLPQINSIIRKLEHELKVVQPGNFFYSLALFMEIIVHISRLSTNETPDHSASFLIGNAISFMNKNFMTQISIDQLAYSAKMSRRNFFRQFQNSLGCTPIQYLMKIRLNHASEMLLYSDRTINEIALACGFYDSNYFCRKFKESLRMTPRQFRLRSTVKKQKNKRHKEK